MTLPDVQDSESEIRLGIGSVGVCGVKKSFWRKRGSKKMFLNAEIDVTVDLGAKQKGVHMSRNVEAINEIVESAVEKPVEDSEDLCLRIAKKLLEKHDYAKSARVGLRAHYPVSKKTKKTGKSSQEVYTLVSRAFVEKKQKGFFARKSIGVEVLGMTVCPCSVEMVRDHVKKSLAKKGIRLSDEDIASLPLASHDQRGKGFLSVETPEGSRVEADDLIRIVEESMSSEIYEVLKREDELDLVLRAHKNPVFVEDVVRRMLAGLVEKYPALPDDSVVAARQTNYESVHPYDAYAERTCSMGELRREFYGNKKN